MAMFDDFDDTENDLNYADDEGMPEESSNRTFIIAASVLGGIILLALLCVAGYAFFVLPNQNAASAGVEATQIAQLTQVPEMLTQSAVETALMSTPLASPSPISSPTSSPTPVIAVATDTPTATPNIAATGTVAAALTLAAEAIMTVVPVSSALPDGGFADDVGLPGLIVMMVVFIAVIFFARKLRKNSSVA